MLSALGEAALRSLVLAGAVQCALWVLRVRRPQLVLAAWTVVLLASVAMPTLPRFTPLRVPVDAALPLTFIDGAAELLQGPALTAVPRDGAVEAVPQTLPWSWLEAVYVAVAAGIALRVALGVALSVRLLARAVPIRPGWAPGLRVRISRDILGPVTVARVVLLPADAVTWSAGTRQAVLAHEGAHVARWDFAMLVLSQLNRALFWFSPLPWWLHRRLLALTELASDEQAMAATRDRLGYAETLFEMGRRSGPVGRGPAMARPSTLLLRIDRILTQPAIPERVSRSLQVFTATAVVGLSLAAASFVADPAARTAMALIEQELPAGGAIGLALGDADGQRAAPLPMPPQADLAAPALQPAVAGAGARPASPVPPVRVAQRLAPRAMIRSVVKDVPAPPQSRERLPAPVANDQGRPGASASYATEVASHTSAPIAVTGAGSPAEAAPLLLSKLRCRRSPPGSPA